MRLALVALTLLALAACGGSAKKAVPSTSSAPTTVTSTTSTTTTTTTATTATSATPTAATAVAYAAPVDRQGRQLTGVTVSQAGAGTCEPGSDVIGHGNVYRCFAGNYVYDPCWAVTNGTGSGTAVLCQEDPWTAAAARITMSSPVGLTVSDAPDLDHPWGVELTDGQRCLAAQGAHSNFNGQVVNYSCPPLGSHPELALVGNPNRSRPQWSFSSVTRQGSAQTAGPTVYTAIAYFAGPTPAVTAACSGADLTMSAGPNGAGLGHVGLPFLFRNTGATTCTLHGYPGAAGLDASGQQAEQAVRSPSGYLGGVAYGSSIPTVTLAPGQTASALLESTDNPVGTATSCPTYRSFLVTPPDTTTSVTVSASLVDCSGLSIHPVVAGSTGSQYSG